MHENESNLYVGEVSKGLFKEIGKKASQHCLVANQNNIALPDDGLRLSQVISCISLNLKIYLSKLERKNVFV